MHQRPNYITEPEDEVALVRRCVRQLATRMQQQGEIPPDVTQVELYRVADKHVPQITEALRKSPMYPHWKAAGHLEEHIRYLVEKALNTPAPNPPAVARDQISYVHAPTGQNLTPTWKHSGCGGTVYSSKDSAFKCNRCKKTGELGVEFPREMTPPGANEVSAHGR